MTTTMTSHERVATLLRHELPDRIGLFDHYWGETLPRWLQEGYPDGVAVEEYFGYDLQFAGGWIDTTPFRGVSELVAETDEWTLTKNGAGATFKYWKHKSGTPEHVDFDCCTPQRWEEVYKPQLSVFDPERVTVAACKEGIAKAKANEKFSVFSGLFIFELLRGTLGDVCMLESFALEPEWIHDFCRTYTDFYLKYLDHLFAEAGQPDGAFIYEDLGYSKGLFCSPTMLDEMIMPYYRELFAYFHNRDMPVILHSCGGVTEAVPLIIAAGVDCLQPMEVKAGVDVISLAEQFGDRLSFMGNIDIRVLEQGDKAAIEAEIVGKMETLKSLGAAYFWHTDHSVSPNVSFETYQYAMKVYKEHCAY